MRAKESRRFRKKILTILCTVSAMCHVLPAHAEQPAAGDMAQASVSGTKQADIGDTEQMAVSEKIQDSQLADETQDMDEVQDFGQALPARYSLIDEGRKPLVRSQGNTGTCWAISAVSAIEADLLPERSLILSPEHMSLQNGFQITQEDGGDYYMIMSYLSDWKGPVLEAEDPYGDAASPEGLSAAVHVQEIRMLRNMSRDEIKRMILRYGAAQSSLCLNRERTDTDEYHYYNALTGAYFDPLMEELDHDILILGWDDGYSRDHFRIRPPEDGAWICQNTWGESFGEDGVFYVSYEDRNLFRKGGLVYARIEDADNYDRVYENDSLGWQGRQGYEKEECWFAGAFTPGEKEELAAVGLYSTGPGTTCSVYVIREFAGKDDLENLASFSSDAEAAEDPAQNGPVHVQNAADAEEDGASHFAENIIYAAQARMDHAGFYTIDLDEPVQLEAGQTFAIAVRIHTPGEVRPVAVEMEKDRYTENVELEGRHTWISPDAVRWENTQMMYLTNVCLKAYTKLPE